MNNPMSYEIYSGVYISEYLNNLLAYEVYV